MLISRLQTFSEVVMLDFVSIVMLFVCAFSCVVFYWRSAGASVER